MLEVPVKIREREYFSKKTGENAIDKFIKFIDLGTDQYVIVEKLYGKCLESQGSKDGKPFTAYKTIVEYKGERVSVGVSQASVVKWNELPIGKIKVSKSEFEKEGKTVHSYNYEVA